MHSFIAASLVATAFAALANAQSAPYLDGTWHHTVPANINCGPDILVDDFSVFNRSMLPLVGEIDTRQVNLLGGDYGGNNNVTLKFAVQVSQKNIEVTPLTSAGFFFFKFDAGACYDLSNINSLAFDLIAPVGGSFDIGLTQKTADCKQRLDGESSKSDTKYVPLTKYTTPDGKTKQTVVIPFYDLAGPTALGTDFDFIHLKDVTFINWKPLNAAFQISDIRLRRSCGGNGPLGTNKTISAGSIASLPGSTAPSPSGTSGPASSASIVPAGTSGAVAAEPGKSNSATTIGTFGAASIVLISLTFLAL
ncbi:hypothetical protein BDZ88DRAFT_48671 [Geranomyces variabilis]|nr:hypothetical protein BDZ88DRAFT_48671 [Geranomyces variabilis]KAJ3134955.1 hypothetical protein HDU90_004280 [Geranomyces variabilis]